MCNIIYSWKAEGIGILIFRHLYPKQLPNDKYYNQSGMYFDNRWNILVWSWVVLVVLYGAVCVCIFWRWLVLVNVWFSLQVPHWVCGHGQRLSTENLQGPASPQNHHCDSWYCFHSAAEMDLHVESIIDSLNMLIMFKSLGETTIVLWDNRSS